MISKMSFTVEELYSMIYEAERQNTNTVTVTHEHNGIGANVKVLASDGTYKDITDYGSW